MSKYFNPRLLNAVIAGTGMRNPVRPHVILGSEDGEFVRGDLMDANAIQEFVSQKISDLVNDAPEALDTLKELSNALNDDSNFATVILNKFNSLSTYTTPFVEECVPQIGYYLYADFTCGSDPRPGYLGRCIGTADLYDDNMARWATVSSSKMKWSEESVDTSLPNYDTDTESMLGPGSSSDFNGLENTAVLTALSADYPAADWASQAFGGHGYLPAAGELLRDVDKIFTYFPTSGTTGYWSSTEYSGTHAWFLGPSRQLESSYLKVWADNKVVAFYKGNPSPKTITLTTSETQAFNKDSNFNIWSNIYSQANTIPEHGVSGNIMHGSGNTFAGGSSRNTVIGNSNNISQSSNDNIITGSENTFSSSASSNIVIGSSNTVQKANTVIKGSGNKRYVSAGQAHSSFGDPIIAGSGNVLQNGGNAGVIYGGGNTVENSGYIYRLLGDGNTVKEGGPSRTIIGDSNTLQSGAKVEFLSGNSNQLKTGGTITRAGFGNSNTIESSGGVEFLAGDENVLGGYTSRFIFGNKNNTEYAGRPLIVVGDENRILSGNGDNITFGNKNTVYLNAVVFGLQNTASLKDSYVFGKENEVSILGQQAADNSEFPQEQVIFGRGNHTYGSSFIYGKNNTSDSSCHGNFISGYNNVVDGSYVTVFGKNNNIQSGDGKIIVGYNNTSSGSGVNIFGNNNSSLYPQYGLVIGTNHQNGAYETGGITCGTYSAASNTGIFVVGDGTQSARSNAFEITKTQTISRGTVVAPDVSFTYGSGASATTQSLSSLYGQVQALSSALEAAVGRIAALEAYHTT